jgi:hypothetical protein
MSASPEPGEPILKTDRRAARSFGEIGQLASNTLQHEADAD